MASILELRSAEQDRKNLIIQNLYGASDAASLRAAASKTDEEIMSSQGMALIQSLKSVRSAGIGCFHFSTSTAAAGTFTVKTSTGYARLVLPNNTLGVQAGTGDANSNITLTIPAGSGHLQYAVISVTNGGTTAGGAITQINITANRRIHALDVSALTSCTSLVLTSNLLTSFIGTGLTSCSTLTLSENRISSFNGNGLSACEVINLSSNNLTSFIGTGLTICSTLYLSGNPIISFNGSGSNPAIIDLTDTAISVINLSNCSNVYQLFLNGVSAIIKEFSLNENSFSDIMGPLIEIIDSVQTTNSLNLILSSLPQSSGYSPYIDIKGNPGSLTCNTDLAPDAWSVIVTD